MGIFDKGPGKDIKKIVNQAKSAVNEAKSILNEIKSVRDEVKSVRDEVKKIPDEIRQLGKDVKYDVATTGNNYRGALEKAGKAALDDIESKIRAEVQDMLDSLTRAITKEGLKEFRAAAIALRDHSRELNQRRPDLYDDINDLSAYLQLGPVKMDWSSFLTRIDAIITSVDIWIDRPPSLHRTEIITVVRTLGPTTVDLGISVNLALLIGSKELGIGAGFGAIRGDLIYEMLDRMLQAMGVPE